MYVTRILFLFSALIFTEAKWQKREVSSICEPGYHSTRSVQCYCIKDTAQGVIRSAECYATNKNVTLDDSAWDDFTTLSNVLKLTLTNTRGIPFTFIPTNALRHTLTLNKIDVKYGNIEKVPSFAFANLSFVQDIQLRDSQIQALETHAFAHHKSLKTIGLDQNNIVEINRDVFIDLPALETLYLTSNKIITVHDRAFVHITSLSKLEVNMNKLFSLNSETFSGLSNLQKLDLSGNKLEVIGDNTFLPLINLKSLNLEGNKIQMLDEKAFNGLFNLEFLSLAHNKLADISNKQTFESLGRLVSLSLRGNQLKELKSEVMAPILSNFYSTSSGLDVEDNNFPCDCRLDWFMEVMNETRSKNLELALQNLKCQPSPGLRDAWAKLAEADKADPASEEEPTEYEYYDETQLNGKLFYTDVRDLINCSKVFKKLAPEVAKETTLKPTTKASPTVIITPKPTTTKPVAVTKSMETTGPIQLDDAPKTTTEVIQPKRIEKKDGVQPKTSENEIRVGKKDNRYTTSRLATVSASPIGGYEEGMASDEAKPDRLKAHRSIDYQGPKHNSANRNVGLIVVMLPTLRLLF